MRDLALPPEVDVLTPSQIAAMLGWDEVAAVRAVPMTDEEAGVPSEPMPEPEGEQPVQRLRRIM